MQGRLGDLLSAETNERTAAARLAHAAGRPPAPSLVKNRQQLNSTAVWCRSPAGYIPTGCEHGSAMWAPLRCRRCEGCQAWRRRAVAARIEHGLRTLGGSVVMLTLTSLPGSSVADVMRAWNWYRGWLRRRVTGLEYVAVKERGPRSGMLHLHVLLAGWEYIPQAELSRKWEECSGAFRVDVRRRSAEVVEVLAGYVSKYVAKAVGQGDVRKCVTFSSGFPRPAPQERLWHATGLPVRVLPAALARQTLGAGCLVTLDAGCDCVAGARDLGLNGHLFLQRVQNNRGPP